MIYINQVIFDLINLKKKGIILYPFEYDKVLHKGLTDE